MGSVDHTLSIASRNECSARLKARQGDLDPGIGVVAGLMTGTPGLRMRFCVWGFFLLHNSPLFKLFPLSYEERGIIK